MDTCTIGFGSIKLALYLSISIPRNICKKCHKKNYNHSKNNVLLNHNIIDKISGIFTFYSIKNSCLKLIDNESAKNVLPNIDLKAR